MKVCVNDSTLKDIATAVRERLGVNTKYKPSEIPQAIRNIEGSGFDLTAYASGNLTKLTIPGTVSTVDAHAFSEAVSNVTELTLEEGVSAIEDGVLVNTNTMAYNGAFKYLGRASGCQVNFPSTLSSIGSYAFGGMRPAGRKLVIPANITSIGTRAFYKADFLEVYFKGMPTSVASYAFYNSEVFVNGATLETVTRKIYVPWSEGEGPDLGIDSDTTEIIYDYVYEE